MPKRQGFGTAASSLVCCVLLFAGGLFVLAPYVHAMATTSLWTDEIHTILNYSGRGPLVTLFEYHEPNNHVFFNLVNSLTPGSRSVQPVRARLWSFAATFAMLGLAFFWFARRGSPEWGAFLFCVLSIQIDLLDLVLQARGYAFLCLFALIASMLTLSLLKEITRRRLIGLAVVTMLGTWTVPTFVFFIGALWACLLIATRRRDVFLAGAGAAGSIAIVYAPLAKQMVVAQRIFNRDFPVGQFSVLSAPRETLEQFLLRPLGPLYSWKIASILVMGIVVLFLSWRGGDENRVVRRGVLCLVVSVAVLFAACLLLKGPPIRTAAFVALPLAFGATLLLRLAALRFPRAGQGVVLVLALGMALRARTIAAKNEFTPIEAWMELAATLHETFPEGTEFFVSSEPQYLSGYLLPRDEPTQIVDVSKVSSGLELFLETPIVEPAQGRIDARKHILNAVGFRIPQRRTGYQMMWFCPPNRSFLLESRSPSGERLDGLCDRDLRTSTGGLRSLSALRLDLEPGHRYRSLVVVTSDENADFEAEAFGSSSLRLVLGPIRRARDVTLVSLRDQSVASVLLIPSRGERKLPSIAEIWAYAVP